MGADLFPCRCPVNRGQAGDLIGRAALSAHQKLILLAYMSHLPSDRPVGDGVAWPGLSTLCVWASCSRSTAQAARAELLAAGLLVAVERGEQAMRCRIDTDALASWPAGERPAQRERTPAQAEDGGCRLPAPVPDTGTPAGNRHRGVPPVGIGGAASRQGGVPVIGTEPSSDNPPHEPSTNNPPQLLSAAPPPAGAGQRSLFGGQVEQPVKPRRPTPSQLADAEAADLLQRLDAMRLQRHPGGRPLSLTTWLPKLRTALKRQSAQEVIDGWTWVLRSPEAAWHRGEERGGADRTRDLALVLAHPEYAARRTWRGLEAAHEHDIEARPAESLPAQVWPLTPYQIAAAERERREQEENEVLRRKFAEEAQRRRAELGIDDDDICF